MSVFSFSAILAVGQSFAILVRCIDLTVDVIVALSGVIIALALALVQVR